MNHDNGRNIICRWIQDIPNKKEYMEVAMKTNDKKLRNVSTIKSINTPTSNFSLIEITPLRYFQDSPIVKDTEHNGVQSYASTHTKLVLIILNKSYNEDDSTQFLNCTSENITFHKRLKLFWKQACYVALTDGAIKIVDDLNNNIISQNNGEKIFLPDLVVGDLDSADPQTLVKYEGLGTKIVRRDDQNETDFTKCLRVLGKELGGNMNFLNHDSEILCTNKSDIYEIIVLGGLNGRFDHILAAINTLYIVHNEWIGSCNKISSTNFSIFPLFIQIVSHQSLAFLLAPHFNYDIKACTGLEGETCGIIPFLGKCDGICTTGLKWNLQSSDIYEFGHLISTSNKFQCDPTNVLAKRATIISNNIPIIFTMEILTNLL